MKDQVTITIIEHDGYFSFTTNGKSFNGSEPFLGNKSNALNIIMELIYSHQKALDERWTIKFELREEDERKDLQLKS
ncbi:MAG: hypothetical protein D4S01_11430 [Dehalococcoidia bacterium]|nr:MAG: hypothetical protein D4S01_11430 [Dehalococcoidia bacterium]